MKIYSISNADLPRSRRRRRVVSTTPFPPFETTLLPFTGKLNVEDSSDSSDVCDKSNISCHRTSRWKAWEHYERSFPILKNATQYLVQIVKRKLDVLENFGDNDENANRLRRQNQFELFGCNYIFNNEFKPFLLRSSPALFAKPAKRKWSKACWTPYSLFWSRQARREERSKCKVEVPLF